MKIKKLEMVGFKSFVDRTVVNFDHEVLGIVGPNGCGKSNIVDAIRWCMGEQSAKHLRGRSMEDVLFSGSESRQGTDFAEVTLTFENDDGHDLPIEYRDYPEIAVTRRLHRSGESEYLINKTTVRLKDVTDLFLGTGAGTKAYSIVEQGKIGLITTAKPEDRRMLIEEAAGITKFKSKKKQAERKMELTQQNLLRVSDIVAEIERNIGSLKRQAAKAERYVSYKKELEDLQLYEASHKYLELVGWIKLETGEVTQWTETSDAKRSALVVREAELEAVRLDAHAADEELEKAHNTSFAAENAVRAEEAAIARAKDKIDALRKREEQASAELVEIDAAHARLEAEREIVCGEVVALEAEDSAQAEQLAAEEERLAEVTAESGRADAKVHELRQAIAKAQAEIASAEAKLAGFERRKAEMHARVEKMRAERENLEGAQIEHTSRARELELSVFDLKAGKVTSAEEKQRHEERLAELRHEIGDSERSLDEAKHELSRKRSRLHALEEMHARLEGVGAGVKALVGTKDPALCGLVADRMEAPAELTQALAGLLGSRLQDVVVRDIARGAELLESLAAGKKGRATIVPLHPPRVAGGSAVLPSVDGVVGRLVDRLRFEPDDAALVHSLVGDAIVVRDLAAAYAVRAEAPLATVVTLDGTVLYADGRVSGGTGEEVAAGMLSSNREMRELGEEVQRLDALASERLARHQALRQSIGETQGALDRARQQAHKDELSLVTAERDLRASQQQLESTRKRLETLCAEMEDLSSLLLEAGHERDEAQRILDEARGVLDERQGGLGDAEAVSASWREQVEARRHVVTERKVRRAGAREKLTAATGTLQRLARSTEELSERARRLNDELHAGARTMGETAALIVLHKELLQQSLDAQRVAADALAEARGISDGFRADMGEREAQIKDLRNEADEARASLTEHEMGLRERTLAMDHLLEGVAERFRGLRLARVVGDYHMRPPPDEETRGRISELTQLLERMGSVNLDAVREHEEAEKRYTFYTTQKADLDKALADLERAIQQMNRESKKLFAETFEAVNAKFQEIFPKMFRGGRASLRLTNPDDMLETGIDILAQPPGKKISSIELMSGGEKALTAVSLIFAIFQIKPSPFCILDEVDAPLDEANVARYNDLIREMTDRSQFILITHIKRTMQLVDVLYGVTMQESGVSRLVSVKLSESAEKKKALPAAQAGAAVA
ncbi:MAG: chromosome segregation protein SMC [Polyangiaceae bacterium]